MGHKARPPAPLQFWSLAWITRSEEFVQIWKSKPLRDATLGWHGDILMNVPRAHWIGPIPPEGALRKLRSIMEIV